MDAVMAFDLGTTHLKWVIIEEASGLRLWEGQENVSPVQHDDASEQDPIHIAKSIDAALLKGFGYGHITRVAFSSAMHSFIVIDENGQPLTQSWTWMDKRGLNAAHQLRQNGDADNLRRLSGVPVHPMSPLVKWLSVKDRMPPKSRPVALKDYILHGLTGQWITDYTTAASSGFLGIDNHWLPEALKLAHLDPDQLPSLQPMTQRLADASGRYEVVVGASDGATAHRHLNIPADGSVGVLAMGTSGALRTTQKDVVNNPELFCYSLGPELGYLVGSAFSNVGNLLDWLNRTFERSIDQLIGEGLQTLQTEAALPLALPYWFGERSPWWNENLRGSWLHLAPEHGRAEMVASVLLSMAAQYWHGLDSLKRSGAPIREIRGGSGLLDMPEMAQWMADALGQDIVLHDERDASLLGAVDLALARREPNILKGGSRYQARGTRLHQRVTQTWAAIASEIQALYDLDLDNPPPNRE